MAYDRDPFRELVIADAKGQATPTQSQGLRSPDIAILWHDMLIELKRDLETQLSERKARLQDTQNQCHQMPEREGKKIYFDTKVEYDRWRVGVLRVKGGVEKRLMEAQRLGAASRLDSSKNRSHLWELLNWACRLIPDEGEGADWHTEAAEAGVHDADEGREH